MIEKTEGVIRNGQSKDTGNIGYTKHRGGKIKKNNTKTKTKTKTEQHNTENQK